MAKRSESPAPGRKTTAQWMREMGFDKIWKSALNKDARRRFKLARALVNRFGLNELEKRAAELEAKAKELREAKTFYETSLEQLKKFRDMVNGWGTKKP